MIYNFKYFTPVNLCHIVYKSHNSQNLTGKTIELGSTVAAGAQ